MLTARQPIVGNYQDFLIKDICSMKQGCFVKAVIFALRKHKNHGIVQGSQVFHGTPSRNRWVCCGKDWRGQRSDLHGAARWCLSGSVVQSCLWAQAVITASQMWLYSSRTLPTPPSIILPLFHATSFSVTSHMSLVGGGGGVSQSPQRTDCRAQSYPIILQDVFCNEREMWRSRLVYKSSSARLGRCFLPPVPQADIWGG